jgi:hypothetical protein
MIVPIKDSPKATAKPQETVRGNRRANHRREAVAALDELSD